LKVLSVRDVMQIRKRTVQKSEEESAKCATLSLSKCVPEMRLGCELEMGDETMRKSCQRRRNHGV